MHAPHCPSPQPYFEPVRSSRFRSTQSSGSSGGASTRFGCPLTVRRIDAIRGRFYATNRPGPPQPFFFAFGRAFGHESVKPNSHASFSRAFARAASRGTPLPLS